MIKEAISLLVQRKDLSSEMMSDVMEEIMTNQATDAQKASFLTALAMKGETIGEITAAAKVMRAHCERFLNDMDVLEIVGTGGDGSNTFNISTLSALVTSAEFLLQSTATELLQANVELLTALRLSV